MANNADFIQLMKEQAREFVRSSDELDEMKAALAASPPSLKSVEQEFQALREILILMEPLSPRSKMRIIQYLQTTF